MDYRKAYLSIVNNAKKQNRKKGEAYYEIHHILPKSLFPLWKRRKSNLVLLTAREHFICHLFLEKIYPHSKMFLAVWRLANDGQNNYCKKNSREYSRLREKYVKIRSKPVICLETLEFFNSNTHAANELGVSVSSVNNVLNKENRTCKGYHWEYYDEKKDYKKNKFYNLKKKQNRQIICLETLEVGTYNYFSKKMDIKIPNICKSIKDDTECKGFHFKHYDENKKYKKRHKKYICLETLEEYDTKREIAKKFKICLESVDNILSNKIKKNWYHFEVYDYNKNYENNCYFGNKYEYDKLSIKQIICLETLEVFDSFQIAAKKNGISSSNLSNAIRKNSICNGYHWGYYNMDTDYSKNPFYGQPRGKTSQVRKILCNTTGEVFDSYADIRRKLGLNKSTVKKIIEGEYKGKEKRVFSFFEQDT